MPMYNFQCTECGLYVHDKLVKNSEEVILCPECNTKLQKLPSSFNFSCEPAAPRGL